MTSLEYRVGANADDGIWITATYTFSATTFRIGSISGNPYNTFIRFDGVTIPADATIVSASLRLYLASYSGTLGEATIKIEDAADPDTITSRDDGVSRTLMGGVAWTPGTGGAGWINSEDISALISAALAKYSYAGAAMQFVVIGGSGGYVAYNSKNTVGDYAPYLLIEYTEAAGGGNPYYAYAQMM